MRYTIIRSVSITGHYLPYATDICFYIQEAPQPHTFDEGVDAKNFRSGRKRSNDSVRSLDESSPFQQYGHAIPYPDDLCPESRGILVVSRRRYC